MLKCLFVLLLQGKPPAFITAVLQLQQLSLWHIPRPRCATAVSLLS